MIPTDAEINKECNDDSCTPSPCTSLHPVDVVLRIDVASGVSMVSTPFNSFFKARAFNCKKFPDYLNELLFTRPVKVSSCVNLQTVNWFFQ